MAKVKSKSILRKEYQEKLNSLRQLEEAARRDIEEILKQNNISINSVSGRVKTFDSFYNKAQTGLQKGQFINPIDEMWDLVGIRAVVIFIDDLEKISTLLQPTFKILKVERKGSSVSVDTFGYESDHYILQYDQVTSPRYTNIQKCHFELQVRTILMDAWASLSHEIDYKTGGAVPSDLRRIFFGLSGMFVVADKTFQDLRNASKNNQENLSKEDMTFNKLSKQEINLDTFKAYLNVRFPDRAKKEFITDGSDTEYSEFIDEIKAIGGYETIKDIDEAFQNAGEVAKAIEKDLAFHSENPDTGETLEEMHVIGVVRAMFDLYDDKYFERINKSTGLYWVQKIQENKVLVTKKKKRED